MNCVYTYNGVNYSYAELAAALHGGLLEKLVTDGVVGGEVSLNPDERVEEVRVETDVKSGIESSDELTTETNVDNVGGILDVVGNIKNKKIESQYGSINTGDIEVVKSIPNVNKVIAKGDNGVEIKVVINGDKLNGTLLSKNGNYLFRAMQGRYFILAKVGDFYLPFYISSAGTSGKIQGQWYPFFGYNNWLVKGRVGKNGEMKYSEKISKVQTLLNENFILPAKYLSADNKVAIGEQFVPARNSKGDIIREGKYNFEKMIPNEKRKVLYDLSEDIDVITHHHQEQKKETRLNEHDWVAEKTGFNPKNVVNDGGLSADNWINDIIALTENVEQASNGVIKKSAYLIEEIQDATKITSAESADVGEPSRNGEKVGEGNAEKEEVAEAQEEKEVVEEKPKQVKERFYKHVEGKGYVEVKKAKPTYLFGTEKAFYTKEGGEYIVSDALTGAEIGRSKNASQAIANAEQNAGSAENLQNARERFYEAYGQSPYAKLQQELTFTQSLVNDAIGIGDETDMEQLEDKGIIKKQCE